MKITDASKFARLGALVDKALNLPRDPDHRGSRCPPAPFGRTERFTTPGDADGDGFPAYEIPTSVSNGVAASARLTGQERAEYAQILAGESPPPKGARRQ